MRRKLCLFSMVLFVLLNSSLVSSAKAAAVWSQTYGGTGDDWARSMVQTSDGGYAIAGSTESFGAGQRDFWLVKTDENGFVPEYSSWLIPSLVLTTMAFIIINRKKLLRTR